MKRVFTIYLAFMWCMMAHVQAQSDSTGCNAQLSYTYVTSPSGITTFTASYSGVDNAWLAWYTPSGYVGSGPAYTGNVLSGTEVCVTLTGMDSTSTDSCYTSYCETFEMEPGACNLSVYYTTAVNPNGSVTYTAHHPGVSNPLIHWYSPTEDYGSGYGITLTGPFVPGDDMCVAITAYTSVYDSLEQVYLTDTCYADFCDVLSGDSMGCNAQVSYTYTTNSNGVTLFTATHSGVPYNATVIWYDGSSPYPVASGNTWSANIAPGTTVCAVVTGFATYYDSLQQISYTDSCSGQYCEVINPPASGCNAQISYTYATSSTGVTTFAALSSGVMSGSIQWFGAGAYLGSGNSYSGTIANGTEICAVLTGFNYYYDSVQQTTIWDSCYAESCGIFYNDSFPSGCNAQLYFTQSVNPGGGVTLTAYPSGVMLPSVQWYGPGGYLGSGTTYSGTFAVGTQVCAVLTGFNYYYDSLQQTTIWDSCYTEFCDFIYADSTPWSGCQAGFTYYSDSLGGFIFAGTFSGSGAATMEWSVNGTVVGSGAFYSGPVTLGDDMCFTVYAVSMYYDSLQGWYSDTCFAQHCEEVQAIVLSVPETAQLTISAYPNPATNTVSLAVSNDAAVSGVEIVDVHGRTVLVSESHEQISLSYLEKGMYYIRALDASGRCIWTDQLLKN